MLIMHADLPLIQPADINLLADALAANTRVALAPAGDGGTNALACSVPSPIPFYFGRASLARHLAEVLLTDVTGELRGDVGQELI